MNRHRANRKKRLGKKFEASYTVEAALVMAVTLFLIASLIHQAFEIHGDVVGNLVLQDALEQSGHREEEQKIEIITENANEDLHEYFWCGGRRIGLKENGRRIEGWMREESGRLSETSVSVKQFDPEKFLRLIRALTI